MTQITEALEAARAHILDSYRTWQADDVSAVPPTKSGAGAVIAKIDAVLSTLPIAGEGKEGWKLVPRQPTAEMDSVGYDTVPSDMTIKTGVDHQDIWKAMFDAAPSSPGKDGGQEVEDLDARMKAAGMYTVAEMMGITPLTHWNVHSGMNNLDFFGEWLDRKVSEYLRMKAGYELGDKDKGDELYEWVLAHAGAFSTIRENFRAAREGDTQPASTALVECHCAMKTNVSAMRPSHD